MLANMWENTLEISVRKNYISSIEVLNQFSNLRFLDASENYLQEVSLNLPRLEKLDLRHNFIARFPFLHQLPRLKVLSLAHNRLEDFRVDFKPNLPLQSLDVSHNAIAFATNQDFYEQLLEGVRKLRSLKLLNLEGKPFLGQVERLEQIVAQMPGLEELNGERVEVYRRVPGA
jgi:Leucine-rich repeat (LRR) protein